MRPCSALLLNTSSWKFPLAAILFTLISYGDSERVSVIERIPSHFSRLFSSGLGEVFVLSCRLLWIHSQLQRSPSVRELRDLTASSPCHRQVALRTCAQLLTHENCHDKVQTPVPQHSGVAQRFT